MQKSRLIFDKRQRRLISDAIRGVKPWPAPIADYSIKVQNKLQEWKIDLQKKTIHQQIWWATNAQDTFNAAYEVLKAERPEQAKNLFNGTQLMKLESVDTPESEAIPA